MAAVTRRTGYHVCRRLAGRLRPIMASGARARDIAVNDTCRFPGHKIGVAVTARIGAGNVRGRLAFCGRAVVTIRASPRNLTMIEIRRLPGRRGMATTARRGSSNVCGRFSSGGRTVVAATARNR